MEKIPSAVEHIIKQRVDSSKSKPKHNRKYKDSSVCRAGSDAVRPDCVQRGACVLGRGLLAVLRPAGAEPRPLPRPPHHPQLQPPAAALPPLPVLAAPGKPHQPGRHRAAQGLRQEPGGLLTLSSLCSTGVMCSMHCCPVNISRRR